jgi:hypothetical protein
MGTLLRVGARLALTLWLVPVRCYQYGIRRSLRALSTVLVGRIGRRDADVDIHERETWPMPAVLPTSTRIGGSSQLVSARMTRYRLEIHPERPLLRESIAGQYADGTPIPPVVEERDIADYSTVRIQALPPSVPTPPAASSPPPAPRHTPVGFPAPSLSPNYQTYRPCLPVAVMTEQGILLRALPERLPRSAMN